jgi:hypothetical protein
MQSAAREYVSTRITSADAEDPLYENHRCRSVTSLVLLPVRWQPGMTATNDPKTEKVVDTSGRCQPTKARAQRRSTSSMRRPARPLRTGRTAVSLTALCW